jgi:hypothetical protein
MIEQCKKVERAESRVCAHRRAFIDEVIEENPAERLTVATVVEAALYHFEEDSKAGRLDLRGLLCRLRLRHIIEAKATASDSKSFGQEVAEWLAQDEEASERKRA